MARGQFIPQFFQTNGRAGLPFRPQYGDHFSKNANRTSYGGPFDYAPSVEVNRA